MQNFWEKYREKKIFRHIFAVCFGMAAACVVLACVLGYGWFRKLHLEDETENYENSLYSCALMLESYMTSLENVLDTLMGDVYISRIMSRETISWDKDMIVGAHEIRNMLSGYSMFHSIYVFQGEEYVLKTSNPSYPLNSAGDNTMIEFFYDSSFGEYACRYYIDAYGERRTLLCLTDGTQNSRTLEKESGILVSLDLEKVFESIFSQPKEGEQFLLLGSSGNILYAMGGNYHSGTTLKDEELLKMTLGCTDRETAFLSLEGQMYLVSCISMENGFRLISMVPDSYVMETVNLVGMFFLAAGFALVIVVLVFTFIVSTTVYSPIELVVRSAHGEKNLSQEMDERVAGTELYSIVNTYRTMLQTLNDYTLQKEQNELAQYLSDHGQKKKLPAWVEEIYGGRGFRIRSVVLRISDVKDLQSNNTEAAIAFEMQTVMNIVRQSMKNVGDSLVCLVDGEYIAVFLFAAESMEEELIVSGIRDIFAVTREYISIGMEAGISDEKEDPGELRSMYQMARAATAYRFLCGASSIITEEEMACRALEGNENIEIEGLLTKLRNMDREGFTEEYFRVVNQLRAASLQTATDVLFRMGEEFTKYEKSLRYQFAPLSKKEYENLSRELAGYDYIDDMRDYFFHFAERIWMLLGRSRQSGWRDVVDEAIAYMQENYADSCISAQYLADRYRVTPSYFSRMFNERTGVSFPDYLSTLRIEKAKEILLSGSNRSIQEVSEMVGYNNPSYFTATFRKKYGVTPGQFRKNHREEETNK